MKPPRSISGSGRMESIYVFETGSSQTDCQMPVTGVYQMPFGSNTCFPRAWVPVSLGAQTATTSFCSPCVRCLVTSKVNGLLPPRCVPSFLLFTHTSVSHSTASNCSNTDFPFHVSGTVKEVLYQSFWSGLTSLPTPESVDSGAKGTRICPSNFTGRAAFAGTMA